MSPFILPDVTRKAIEDPNKNKKSSFSLNNLNVTITQGLNSGLNSINSLAREVQKHSREYISLGALPFWLGAGLTALAAVGYAQLFYFIDAFNRALYDFNPLVFFAVAPVCFVLGWWLVYRWAPEAAGSGIPQIMAANALSEDKDEPLVDRLLGFKTVVIKVLSSLICLLGGGAIGREGPTLQISAAIFNFVGRKFPQIWGEANRQSLIVAGGAAGIASAFNTPLGGIVYAIEELATKSFHQFRTVVIFAVIVSGLVAQWLLGPYLFLGFPRVTPVGLSFMPFAVMTGIVTGLAGGLFGRGLFRVTVWKGRLQNPKSLLLIALGCGLIVAGLAAVFGPQTMGSGKQVISDLLFEAESKSDWTWITGRILGTFMSYVSGCAGGIFAPSLAIGATIGSQIGHLFQSEHGNLLVLIGMVGFLTGVTRAPFTAFVLVLEMTDRHSTLFPMMLTALVADSASRAVDSKSFYEHIKHRYLAAATSGAGVVAERIPDPAEKE